jgi:hypothetical protein
MLVRVFTLVAILTLPTHVALAQAEKNSPTGKASELSPKPAKTPIDLTEFREAGLPDFSQPRASGAQGAGRELRTLHGLVVDHLGQPMAGVLVAVRDKIGFENEAGYENFDKTDEQGRFVVRGDLLKDRVEVRRSREQIWSQNLEPDQTYVKFVWPKPCKLRLELDVKLCLAGKEFVIASTERGANSELFYLTRAQPHEGVTTLNWLMPGSYRVLCPKKVKSGGTDVERSVDVGEFTIGAGEEKTVHIEPQPGIEITNSLPKWGKDDPAEHRGTYVEIETVKTRYYDSPATVDIAAVDAEGRFHARVPRPGHYTLRINSVAAAAAPPIPPGAVRIGVVRPAPAMAVEAAEKRLIGAAAAGAIRLEVKEGAKVVDVTAGGPVEAVSPTTEQVRAILARQPDLNVSWSNTDVQVASLAANPDRAGVVAELFRIVNDEDSPYEWNYPAVGGLGNMTDTEGVVEGLLALLDVPFREFERGRVISVLNNPQRNVPQVIDRMVALTNERDLRLRMDAYYALEAIASRQPGYKERIVPTLIRGLSDPYQAIRAGTAGVLGSLKVMQAEAPLRALLVDPDMHVRLVAARAIFQMTGDDKPLIRVGTELLSHENLSLRSEAITHLDSLGTLPPATLTALRANLGEVQPGQAVAPAAAGRRGARGRDPDLSLRTSINQGARRTLQKHGAGE